VLGVEDPEQVLGKSYFDLHSHEQALRYFFARSRGNALRKALINVQESTIDPAGNQIDLLTTKAPLRDGDGRIIGVVGIDRDITARSK
jgi:PAS domain S-box-containing protein